MKKKNIIVAFRVSGGEFKDLVYRAEREGISLSQFIRQRLFKKR